MSISNRRSFLKAGVVGGLGALVIQETTGNSIVVNISQENGFTEQSRTIPLNNNYEVIVCGSGPAGVSAAISAAETGAKVLLIEMNACLGGIWTAGQLSWIFDFNKPGLTRRITKSLDERDARRGNNPADFVYEPDEMKQLLEEMCVSAGVSLMYFTQVVAAYKNDRNLTTIVTESKSGRMAWQAKVFIDATGDGDLGFLAGCEWEIGQSGQKDCPCQPLTFNALAMVNDASKLGDYISFYSGRDYGGHVAQTKNFTSEINRAGIEPSYSMPTLFQVRENLLLVMVNHEYNIKPYDIAAMTEATVRARAEVFRIVKGLDKLGGAWKGMRIVASSEKIGIREGRRIKGLYTVTRDDLIAGIRHEDAVTRVGFGVDIHAADKDTDKKEQVTHGNFRTLPYDIPVRALIAKDVDGLMMAGRCISGDFMAHASYRVTGDAVAMGEGAGVVAALAVKEKIKPQQVAWANISKILDERYKIDASYGSNLKYKPTEF